MLSFQMPYLLEIDEIEKTVNDLEAAAYKLDAYSQRLEEKFTNLTKKKKWTQSIGRAKIVFQNWSNYYWKIILNLY